MGKYEIKGEKMGRKKKTDFTKEFIKEQIRREADEYRKDPEKWFFETMFMKIATDMCGTRGYVDAKAFIQMSDLVIETAESMVDELGNTK